MDEGGPRRTVNPIVKVLVLAHMALIASWSLPTAPPAIMNGTAPTDTTTVLTHLPDYLLAGNERFRSTEPVRNLMWSSGLWQYWDMFAPNPANVDYWFDAVVVHKSGEQHVVAYPRMRDLSIWEKYFKERYRKFTERVDGGPNAWKCRAFGQRMALLDDNPDDPPVRVFLRRHWRELAGMDKPVPADYKVDTFYEYIVDPDKLKKDAGR